eukprot:g657.t1
MELSYHHEDLSPKLRKKIRNRIRMRERRKDPEYKDKERRRQAELRANRSKTGQRYSRPRSTDDAPNGSLQLKENQSTQPYDFNPISEFYANSFQSQSQLTQIASLNEATQFASQTVPVELPCLEAERMHEATFLIALPAESCGSSAVPAFVRMAVVPPVPSIINLVILPTGSGGGGGPASNEDIKSNMATDSLQSKTQFEDQVRSTIVNDAKQFVNFDALDDCHQIESNTVANRMTKKLKISEGTTKCKAAKIAKVNSSDIQDQQASA